MRHTSPSVAQPRQCFFRKTDSSCPPKRQTTTKDIFRTSLKATNKKEDVSANDTSSFFKKYSENSTLDFCLSWTLSALCAFSLLCSISCPPEREKRQRQFPVHSCDVVSPAAGIPVPNARYSCSRPVGNSVPNQSGLFRAVRGTMQTLSCTHRIEYGKHHHTDVGKNGQPHACHPESSKDEYGELDADGEPGVLPGDEDGRDSRTASAILDGLSSISTTSAASMAASLPSAPIAIPTSARASTGASLMPSPTKATVPFPFCVSMILST